MAGVTRRQYLGGAALTSGGLIVTGCAGPPAASPATGEPAAPRQTIEVWRPGAKEDKPWGVTVDEVLLELNQAQRRWEVEIIYPGAEYHKKITTQVVAGNPPAAFRGWVSSIQAMAPSEQVTALDGLAKAEKGFNLADFWPTAVALSSYQGKLYGIPTTFTPSVLFYSRGRLREAGIDPNRLPDTLQDWVALGDKLFEKSPEGYAKIGFVPHIPSVTAQAFLPSFGADWFDAKNMKVTANTPEAVACFEWVKSVADRYGVPALDAFADQHKANGWGRYAKNGAMHNGLVPIFQRAGWWMGSALEWGAPDLDLAYRPIPPAKGATRPQAGSVTGNEWMIPQGATPLEGGWAVLKWMGSEAVMLRMAIMDTLLPGRKSVTTHQEYAKQPWSKVWVEVAGNARPEDVFMSGAMLLQRLNAALNDVIHSKRAPKEALDDVTREVQADLDSKRR
ncbi:MAG: extracellular solute-binding protein [Chloroflexota bacterium]